MAILRMKNQRKVRKNKRRAIKLSKKFNSTKWLKKTAKQFSEQVHKLRIRFIVVTPGKTFWFRAMMHVDLYKDSLRLARKLRGFYRKFQEYAQSGIEDFKFLINSCSKSKLRFRYYALLNQLKRAKKKFKALRNKARKTQGWIYDLVLKYARERQLQKYVIHCREDFENADFLRRVFGWIGFIQFHDIVPVDDVLEMLSEAEDRGWNSDFITDDYRLADLPGFRSSWFPHFPPCLSPTSEIAEVMRGVGKSDDEQVSSSDSDDPAHVQRWDSLRTRFGL